MSFKQWWGKGFGIMKRTLDLAIATGRYDELCEMHLNLVKEMEMENPNRDTLGVHSKGRKQKDANEALINVNKASRIETDANLASQEKTIDTSKEGCNDQNLSNTRLDVENSNLANIVEHNCHENKARHCGTCGQVGHSARTCNLNNSSNNYAEYINRSQLPITNDNVGCLNSMNTVNKDHANNKFRRCGTCG
ncbi:4434_t:CDS:2, partial [Gigaspora rosea]